MPISNLATAYMTIRADDRDLARDLARIRGQLSSNLGQVSMAKITGGILAAAGITSLLDTTKNFAMGLIDANAQMQTLVTTFTVMLGSEPAARKLLNDIEQMAAVTPFRFTDLAQSVTMLLN